MAEIIRDSDAEIELQNALNRGDRVWVGGRHRAPPSDRIANQA